MNKHLSLFLFSFLLLVVGCESGQFTSNTPSKSKFTKGAMVYYGDIRNTGCNVLALDIYSSNLSLDSTGTNYVGIGKNLYFDDIYIESSEYKLTDGIYKAVATGGAFTFLPGKNNDGVSSGAYLAVVSDMQISYEYLTIGQFVVQTKGDSTIIDFELETERGEKFQAQFRGILGWYDLLPELSHAQKEFREKYYNDTTDNLLISIGSIGVDFGTSQMPTSGEELILEFNVDTLWGGTLETGRYTVATPPETLEDFANFLPQTITPYFSLKNDKNEIQHCGSWFTSYTDGMSHMISSGYADVSIMNMTYTINYCFNPHTDYEIKGTYVGEIPSIRKKSLLPQRSSMIQTQNITSDNTISVGSVF